MMEEPVPASPVVVDTAVEMKPSSPVESDNKTEKDLTELLTHGTECKTDDVVQVSAEIDREENVKGSISEPAGQTGISDCLKFRELDVQPQCTDKQLIAVRLEAHTDENVKDLAEHVGEPPLKRQRLSESTDAQETQRHDTERTVTCNDGHNTAENECEELSPELNCNAMGVPDLTGDSQAVDKPDLLQCQFCGEPRQITGAWKCFKTDKFNNYLRGCKWAPDGTCILTNSNDNILRVYNLPGELYYDGGERKIIPEMNPVFKIKEADTVYDFCWFPLMSSQQPETACLAVTCKDTPVHLYDAFTGDLRCSYRAYNHVDEVVAAHCVEFNCEGTRLYCGFNKMVRVFDVTRPGREFQERPTFAKEGQRGIISCVAPSPTEEGLYATGSYAKSIALYSEPAGEMVCMFEGQQGGVTQVKFSPDGSKLYSGGRKDNEILCWDMRNPGQILFTLQRTVLTNQRMYFDISSNSRYIVSGNHDGSVSVWDSLGTPVTDTMMSDPVLHPKLRFQAHYDTVNGISLHPTLPLLATASGQRHYNSTFDSDDDDNDNSSRKNGSTEFDNSLRLWWT